MVPTGWDLAYLYVGTDDLQHELSGYLDEPGARKLWHFRDDDEEIVAVHTGEGPLHILVDQEPSGSCVPFFSVPHLDTTTAELEAHGWQPITEPFEIPVGPCRMFEDPTGNTFALFENVRPYAMWSAYADPGNPRAVR